MTAESERFIVDCLNDEPFKLNTTLIAFDNSPPQKLLQILSDVICWITQTEKIDIRTEQADETAMRMFHNLRILKYRPPSDIEQLEEWRVGMVEGSRAAVFPVLYYLLSNVDMLKERAYLARFLVRVDVPGEVQDVDTLNMQNEILAAMERFKEVHKQVVEVRGDTLMVVDIKNDLRSMEQEKEQLNRRIDKVQRKVQAMPNLEKILSSAEMYRKEVERFEQLNAQRSEQRNVVIYIEQKIQRLQQQLKDTQSAGENLDPTDLIHQLEAELETNAYLVNVKLEKEIQTKRGIVSELSKVADMPAIGQNDIDKLKEEVTTLTDHIIQLEEERDKKEETHDENYSIYRHQAATVERKKSAAAQKLQEARTELDLLQKEIVEKKEELRNSSGEEVITSVQFKNFVNKLRQTTITYKKKRSELEDVKAENLVLTRTMEILSQQWVDLKERIEDKGGDVIESIEVPQNNRPKTAMPKTDDKDQLRDMVVTLNTTLDERREHLVPLQERHETRRRMFEQKHDEMRNMKREYERTKADLESEFERLQEESDSLEERYQSAYAKEKMLQVQVGSLEADLDKLRNSQGADLLKKIDDERIKTEAETDMLKSRATQQVDVAAARMQMNMWKSLLKLFEKKLEIVSNEPTKSEVPLGDRRAASRAF